MYLPSFLSQMCRQYYKTCRFKPGLFVRLYSSEQQNIKSQHGAKRAFVKGHLSAYITGIGILLYARYYYKGQRERELEREEVER